MGERDHPGSQARVRCEEPDDIPSIRRVHEAAFQRVAEAAVVDAVRSAGAAVLSMVAVVDAEEVADEAPPAAEAGLSSWAGEGDGWGGAEGVSRAGARAGGAGRVVGGRVVGHALVTPVTVDTARGRVELLGLGPIAVLPEEQGQGIGTMLVEACLERLRESGRAGIVVVGHPAFYPRFGFIPASRWGLNWETDVPEGVFMALELVPGQLSAVRGTVRYRPEFELA